MGMAEPQTGGQLLALLVERYGPSLAKIARETRIGRSTLENWKFKSEAALREAGQGHYRRLFGTPPAPALPPPLAPTMPTPEMAQLLAEMAEMKAELRTLTGLLAGSQRKAGTPVAGPGVRPRRRA